MFPAAAQHRATAAGIYSTKQFSAYFAAAYHTHKQTTRLANLGAGGPGFESPRPCEASGWIKTAVSQYNVVLMDQRGTGRSSPITTINLHKRGSAEEQAK